ncbi:hypothetical protein D3C87_1789830 [compost metagenome]
MTPSILISPILQPVNRIVPTGGVMVPRDRLKIIMMPNCTGSMPNWVQMGRNMGVKISTAGVGSIKVPTSNSTRFMIRRMSRKLSVKESRPEAIRAGILVNASTQDMMEEAASIRITMAVILAVARKIAGRSAALMFR